MEISTTVKLKSVSLYSMDKEHSRVPGLKLVFVGPALESMTQYVATVRAGGIKSIALRGVADSVVCQLRLSGSAPSVPWVEVASATLTDVTIKGKAEKDGEGFAASVRVVIDGRWKDDKQLAWWARHIGDEMLLQLEDEQMDLPIADGAIVKRRRDDQVTSIVPETRVAQ